MIECLQSVNDSPSYSSSGGPGIAEGWPFFFDAQNLRSTWLIGRFDLSEWILGHTFDLSYVWRDQPLISRTFSVIIVATGQISPLSYRMLERQHVTNYRESNL